MTQTNIGTRYVLVIPVPREVEIRIEDRFLNLSGTSKPEMGYHITLLGSFYLPADLAPQDLPAVAEICAATEPFQVEIAGIGGFEAPDSHAAYADIVADLDIQRLHLLLLNALTPLIRFVDERARVWNMTSRYHPHVTLGLGLSDEEYQSFLRHGEEQSCQADFLATDVDLVGREANGPWRRYARYPLGSNPDNESAASDRAYS